MNVSKLKNVIHLQNLETIRFYNTFSAEYCLPSTWNALVFVLQRSEKQICTPRSHSNFPTSSQAGKWFKQISCILTNINYYVLKIVSQSPGGDELFCAWSIHAIVARPCYWRTCNAHMHFSSSGLLYKPDYLGRRCPTHN
jgi:hypothetical protein